MIIIYFKKVVHFLPTTYEGLQNIMPIKTNQIENLKMFGKNKIVNVLHQQWQLIPFNNLKLKFLKAYLLDCQY